MTLRGRSLEKGNSIYQLGDLHFEINAGRDEKRYKISPTYGTGKRVL